MNWLRSLPKQAILLALWCVLVASLVLSLSSGALSISVPQIISILGQKIGFDPLFESSQAQDAVLTAIRAPRVLFGALIGASLALCGACLQGLFRNPLADPGLIGVSSGAALGAAAAIVLFPALGLAASWNVLTLPVMAFASGLFCVYIVYTLSRKHGQISIPTMLLAGIAINALCGALIGVLTYISDEAALRTLTLWSLGSLSGATWSMLLVVAPCLVITVGLMLRYSTALDALLLGESEAQHLGVDTSRLKRSLLVLVSLSVGVGVGFTGVIGFLGLVVPHLIRVACGPNHATLLPASALLGAILLCLSDLVCRTVVAPAELPIGVAMSLLGAPFFLALIYRSAHRHVS